MKSNSIVPPVKVAALPMFNTLYRPAPAPAMSNSKVPLLVKIAVDGEGARSVARK